jgi:bifunctional DNA-binding transcriptional regulator/antitoxin component of YhaV-PrlF toxin-antitoxin module
VLSIPDYLLKEMGIKAGDFVTIDPIRVKNLKFISVNVRATQPKKQK